MRQCKICKENKQLEEFSKNKKCKDGREYRCKACKSKQDKTRAGYFGWNRTSSICSFAISYLKRNGCSVCGFNLSPICIDLHHIEEAAKLYNPSSSKVKTYNMIKKEIIKCVPICSNCHRLYHNGLIYTVFKPITIEEIEEAIIEGKRKQFELQSVYGEDYSNNRLKV